MESSAGVQQWLQQRHKWLQYAVQLVIKNNELSEELIEQLVNLCKKEAVGEFPDMDISIKGFNFESKHAQDLHLHSISEVVGINKLAPKKPLEFSPTNVSVVYGANGSGKSGYIRLMKHAFQSREGCRGKLLGNVFNPNHQIQKAKFLYKLENSDFTHEWEIDKPSEVLSVIDIFDTSFGSVFIDNENEVSYEPPILSFFSQLIAVSESVAAKLDFEIESNISMLPNIPNNISDTESTNWVSQLNTKTTIEEIEKRCTFSDEETNELLKLEQRLSETKPTEKASKLRAQKKYIDLMVEEILAIKSSLSDEAVAIILAHKRSVNKKKQIVDAVSIKAFENSKINGIGSDIWVELWKSAKKFSESLVYTNREFPVTDKEAVCVLCHQTLDESAKERFKSFEAFIKGDTQEQLKQAEFSLKRSLESMYEIPNSSIISTKVDAAGLDEILKKDIDDLYTHFEDRKTQIEKAVETKDIIALMDSSSIIEMLQQKSIDYENVAKLVLEDAKEESQINLAISIKNLKGKQWVSDKKEDILKEVNRLKRASILNKAKKMTNTKGLSQKKGELAEKLISDALVSRFNYELNELGAKKIKVKLVKSKVSKGKVLHKLQLDGTSYGSVYDVLSEGEQRIISIAAFLADVTGKAAPTPFVFDDPISSLDQNFEERVVMRLCTLARERQIIIFTHRLSLVGLIQEYSKKQKIEPRIICIKAEPWGTGEPCDTLLHTQKPKSALNDLINHHLPKVKKIWEEGGSSSYEPHAKFLCTEFRKLLERTVELVLMADIISRYRRDVQTKNKINKLAKISIEDCTLFDGLMTKYSTYEHSQPDEAPIALPEPSELEEDFNVLLNWVNEF
ncbi:MAG: hypothetical protein PHY08_12270 [Candidatus Cloacimonetes bacterium]|nr:hypothetical protein [Candidatus Cloacimonadota bacterium]